MQYLQEQFCTGFVKKLETKRIFFVLKIILGPNIELGFPVIYLRLQKKIQEISLVLI